jgi:DNA polymerase elongation subunit (family B)
VSLQEDLNDLLPAAQKILTIDIETSPNLVFAWGMWDQNISVSQLIEPSRILCFAAKWMDQKKVIFHDEREGRMEMLKAAWDLLNEADIIIGYNHEKFDIPHLNREFLTAGMPPPSPAQYIDLLKINRQRFKFVSNKLGFVTDQLGLETKLETGGQELWNAVLKGDEKAWRKFRKYNIQDVLITEQLFELLAPWGKLPHKGMWNGQMRSCYMCGSNNMSIMGFLYGKVMAYPKLQCNDCGAWNKVLRNGQTRAA